MKSFCATIPSHKKEYVLALAEILIADYDKQEYYTPEEVKEAHKNSTWNDGVDFSCWGMSVFCSPINFERYHFEIGKKCDYVEMKTEMLNSLSTSTNWQHIPGIDINSSWLDFLEITGGLFDGISDLIAGFFDN